MSPALPAEVQHPADEFDDDIVGINNHAHDMLNDEPADNQQEEQNDDNVERANAVVGVPPQALVQQARPNEEKNLWISLTVDFIIKLVTAVFAVHFRGFEFSLLYLALGIPGIYWLLTIIITDPAIITTIRYHYLKRRVAWLQVLAIMLMYLNYIDNKNLGQDQFLLHQVLSLVINIHGIIRLTDSLPTVHRQLKIGDDIMRVQLWYIILRLFGAYCVYHTMQNISVGIWRNGDTLMSMTNTLHQFLIACVMFMYLTLYSKLYQSMK